MGFGTTTVSPVAYNGIEPDTTGCEVGERLWWCGAGQGVLSDGNIGPTHSVDLTDANQVQRFFVWHRNNGPVNLVFQNASLAEFRLSYIDIYTLTLPSAGIGPPTTFVTDNQAMLIVTSSESCTFSSSGNTLSRNIYDFSQTQDIRLFITFDARPDWLFISEIILCSGPPPSPITCDDTYCHHHTIISSLHSLPSPHHSFISPSIWRHSDP